MKPPIKDLGELEKEILGKSPCKSPVIVLDTGGLIDISHAARTYALNGNHKAEKNENYLGASTFLRYLSQRAPVIITPRTYQEIQDHGRMRINAHITELSPTTVDHALKFMTDSAVFIDRLEGDLSLDDARYDAYWTSKECCLGNLKKHIEGCSYTDREIISTAAYLSRCKVIGEPEKKVDKVLVISSDAHVLQGSEFLGIHFGEKYPNIHPISTRH